ncbi:MAG: PAS domain S-box protein, partial [Bacteroidetes bacterium]
VYIMDKGRWNLPSMRRLLEDILPKNITCENYRLEETFSSAGAKIQVNARQMEQVLGRSRVIILTFEWGDVEEVSVPDMNTIREGETNGVLPMSADLCRTIVEGAREGVWMIDRDNRTSFVNHSMANMLGYTPEEMLGMELFSFMDEEGVRIAESNIERRKKGINEQHDFCFRSKTGQEVWVLVETNPLFEQGVYAGAVAMITNITERKRAEEQLRENNAFLHSILESPKGIIVFSLDRSYRYKSFTRAHKEIMKQIWGADIEIGMNMLEVITFEEDRSKAKRNFDRVLEGEQLVFVEEYGDEKLARLFWENRYSPILAENGEVVGLTIFVTDITERRKAEIELNKAFDLLNDQNQRLLNFSYVVSHNLRSHAGNISSLVNYIEELDSCERRMEVLGNLKKVSNYLMETLDNLNEVISVRSSEQIKVQPLQMHEYISRATVILSEQIQVKKALIVNNVSPDIHIHHNPSYLESIVLNFLSNAIRYSHPERQPHIVFECEPREGGHLLRISDNGVGIDLKKNGGKLFGMYKTFHGNPDARGMGLFITKSQIEALGGKVEVESQAGQGTTFRVQFV